MWETPYSREPVNYRLFFKMFVRKLWLIPLGAFLGALIIGGVYCLVNFGIKDGYKYRARTIYYITYADDAEGKELDYYNYFTWQELIHTDYFTDGLSKKLDGMSKDEIIAATYATVESDYRYLYTKSTSTDPETAVSIEKAVSELMVDYADTRKEIESIIVEDVADLDDVEDISLIFVQRALIFGAIIGVIAVILIYVFYSCVDTSVYIPATLEKRYKIPCLGAPSMKEFKDNCKYYSEGKKKIGFVTIGDGAPKVNNGVFGDAETITIDNPLSTEGGYDRIRECDGVFVLVKAAGHNGQKVERLIEQLSRQDIKVTGFILTGENEKLIKSYYGK
jgi:capsular polysaccharide biosynthesis protein